MSVTIMATIRSLNVSDELKRMIVAEHKTHAEVSAELRSLYPGMKGLSTASVKRFCSEEKIHRTSRLTPSELDFFVSRIVDKAGPSYGRKTATGLLVSEGVRAGEKQVGASLRRVNGRYHAARTVIANRRRNPVPYSSDYFGQKVHIDQNEKLVMFGLTHICAVDGYSKMIVGFVTMPLKNNILIYDCLYRNMVNEYGLWDQVRVDHGREWFLMLSVQAKLESMRGDCTKPAYMQTSSKLNHTVERLWCEVNTRVNYPIKAVLVDMLERGQLSLENSIHFYCVSWFTRNVAAVGISLFVQAWNNHPLSGRRSGSRIPVQVMMSNNRARKLSSNVLPSTDSAVNEYISSGGRLSDPESLQDPITDEAKRVIRDTTFYNQYSSFEPIFHSVVNFDWNMFRAGLLFLIDMTYRIYNS